MDPIDAGPLIACLTCDAGLRAAVLGHRFWLLALTIAPGLLAGAAIVAWATRAWARRVAPDGGAATLAWTATILGMGLGGFVDGIVLHQLLQVHAMISSSLPPDTLTAKGVNMVWDGVFHACTWLLTLVGVVSLWRLAARGGTRPPVALFWGGLWFGWGAFNVLDSAMNHVAMRYHDVVEASSSPWAWNAAFLGFGIMQVASGIAAMRSGLRSAALPSTGRT